jgi:hypothetical protein
VSHIAPVSPIMVMKNECNGKKNSEKSNIWRFFATEKRVSKTKNKLKQERSILPDDILRSLDSGRNQKQLN